MSRNSCRPVFALILLTASLWVPTAAAQTPVAGLQAHIDLNDTLAPTDADGVPTTQFNTQAASITVGLPDSSSAGGDEKLFDQPKKEDSGWKGLAHLLEALTPDIDTSIPLSPSQITGRIAAMLDQGQYQAALDVIEKRNKQRQAQGALGTDVQLMFLHARALAALGRDNEAIKVYLDMTTQYPELPEPWNNLAAEYVKQNKLDMAHDALTMALTANPHYPAAQANLGRVQLMLAEQSFELAASLGVSQAKTHARQTQAILQP